MALSPDGRYLATAIDSETPQATRVQIWDVMNPGGKIEWGVQGRIAALGFGQADRFLVSGTEDGQIAVWKLNGRREINWVWRDQPVPALAVSFDGKYVATASEKNSVAIWERISGRKLSILPHERNVTLLAFSPSGRNIVTADSDKTAHVWDISIGREIARMSHDSQVNAVAFGTPEYYLLTATDTAAKRWLWRPDELIREACSGLNKILAISSTTTSI